MSSTHLDQPREANGRFDEKQLESTGVTLSRGRAGTYLFPPTFKGKSAAELIAFWENVEVDDEVLSNIETEYPKRRDFLLREWAHAAQTKWHRDNPSPKLDPAWARTAPHDQHAVETNWKRAYSAAWDDTMAEHSEGWKEQIPSGRVRDVAIAHRMWDSAGDLDDAEMQKALDHVVQIGSVTMTVREAQNTYRLRYMEEITRTRLSDAKADALLKAIEALSRG